MEGQRTSLVKHLCHQVQKKELMKEEEFLSN